MASPCSAMSIHCIKSRANVIEPRTYQQIIPTGEEIWAFHVSVARDIIAETTP